MYKHINTYIQYMFKKELSEEKYIHDQLPLRIGDQG